MEKTIIFDMDGTLADLYGFNGWLEAIMAENATPYAEAIPLVPVTLLRRQLKKMRDNGWVFKIASWGSKNSSEEFLSKTRLAKIHWLKKHRLFSQFEDIYVIPYGTPKYEFADGILFDDEKNNRDTWPGEAYDVNDILGILKELEIR